MRCREEITVAAVNASQRRWAEGVLAIGRVYQQGGDYKGEAARFIGGLYGYHRGRVLFKPTLASQVQFRKTFIQALSYFVGGDITEDRGFALRPWLKIRFGEQDIEVSADLAMAMGNYYFTPVGQAEEIKAEFTFVYRRDADGPLLICLHHSSLPYRGQ